MEYIRIEKASEITGLSVNYLRNMVQRNEIPSYKNGKFIVFNESELREWIDNRVKRNKEN